MAVGQAPRHLRRRLAATQDRTTTILRRYAETWVETRTTSNGRPLRRKTRSHYAYLLRAHILPTSEDMPLKAITPAAVRHWYASLAATPTARAHAYTVLSSILKTAVEDGEITKTPCMIKGATKARQEHEVRPATLDELEVMTGAMPDRLRLLIPLSAWCALRLGEAAELRAATSTSRTVSSRSVGPLSAPIARCMSTAPSPTPDPATCISSRI